MRHIKNRDCEKISRQQDNVFCIIYCTNAKPYLNYDVYKNSKNRKDRAKIYKTYPMVLTQMRHDGKIGFPGGKVEPDNYSLIDGLLRELKEEINLNNVNINKLEILSTYSNHKGRTTTFIYEVTFEEMISIINNSKNAKHAFIENMGSFMLKLDHSTLQNISKHNFSGEGLKDLHLLIKNKKLI